MIKYNKLEQNILNDYKKGLSSMDIEKIYSIPKPTILNYLKRNNIQRRTNSESHRKYRLNINFFDKIDSDEKAYFLGLLYADGCNIRKNNSGIIKITLNQKDKFILEKLSSLVYIDKRKLEYSKGRVSIFYGKKSITRPNYTLRINNKHISDVLKKFGVVERKTFKIRFPLWLKKKLYSSFIRGYNDGDGHIYINKKTVDNHVGFIGTFNFCNYIKNYLNKKLCVNLQINKHPLSKGIYEIRISGNKQIAKFLNWLYKNSRIYMKRKYEKYLEHKQLFYNYYKD